jgi:hypothetical protein
MFSNFLKWYVEKYYTDDFMIRNYKDDYIAKTDLHDAFEQVRKDAEDRKDSYWKEENAKNEEKLKSQHQVDLLVERQKNEGYKREVELYKKRAKIVEDLYVAAITGAQGNQYLATEMRVRIEEVRDVFADLFGSVSGIEKNAKEQVTGLEEARAQALKKEKRIIEDGK